MKKLLILILSFSLMFLLVLSGCTSAENEQTSGDDKLIIASSIVPETGFIEAVAGDLVEIVTIIPPGNSPANYQPTTTEMQALSDADIYFVMHVPTEEANILPKIADFNEEITLVNLRDVVSEQYPLRYMGGSSDENTDEQTVDPHIWLSPKRAMVMVQTIADELSKLDEENSQVYQENAEKFINDLEALDSDITDIVSNMDKKAFMIYHGAYGYFSDDYGLEMIAIEADGKAATAASLEELIEHAKEIGISAIFYQDEFDDTQAQTVAQEIGGSVVKSAPLTKDYIQGLRNFANALSNNGD